ncbi:MAG TPA: carboxypeptidase-like regulatory domain-containing protein [Candidatus Acidoferrales bacterium]
MRPVAAVSVQRVSYTLSVVFRPLFVLAIFVSFASLVCRSARSQGGVKISGTVYFAGDLAPQWPISLFSSDEVLETTADKSGRFEFDGLPPGTYDLQSKDFGEEGEIYGIRVGTKDVRSLILKTKVLGFYPLDHDCGRHTWVTYNLEGVNGGIVSGNVDLYPEVSPPSTLFEEPKVYLIPANRWRRRISVHPDADGNFTFPKVPPGRYQLLAYFHGYWKVRSTVWDMRRESTKIRVLLNKHGHPIICE